MEEKLTGMTFAEAYAQMKQGKKIRRPVFKGYWYLNPEDGTLIIHLKDGKEISYGRLDTTVKNTLANDWLVVEE